MLPLVTTAILPPPPGLLEPCKRSPRPPQHEEEEPDGTEADDDADGRRWRSRRKIVATPVALTILAMAIHDPTGSAHTVAGIVDWAAGVIDAFSAFGRALSGQS